LNYNRKAGADFVHRIEGAAIMKIVILDGYTENPGDLSWEGFE
jgi:hypothetical protein